MLNGCLIKMDVERMCSPKHILNGWLIQNGLKWTLNGCLMKINVEWVLKPNRMLHECLFTMGVGWMMLNPKWVLKRCLIEHECWIDVESNMDVEWMFNPKRRLNGCVIRKKKEENRCTVPILYIRVCGNTMKYAYILTGIFCSNVTTTKLFATGRHLW